MFVITPTSGSQIAVSSAIWPKPRIAELEHEHLGARRRRQHLERQPDLGVEVRAAGGDRAVRRDQRRDQVLRRRLAHRAGDGDHVRGEIAPPGARERAQRRDRMLGGDAPRPRSAVAAASRAHAGAASTPQAPAAQRRGRERAAVDPLARAGRRTGRPGATDARVDHDPRRPAAAAVAEPAHELRAGRAGDPLVGPVPHRRPSASRATATSSNGSLRPRANSCPCSWPLPAITTTSPGSASAIARRIAARRSASALDVRARPSGIAGEDLVDDRLRHLGARVVRGDDHAVGQPRRDLAHQRAAWRGRGRRPRRRRRSRARVASSRADCSTFSSAPGLCA